MSTARDPSLRGLDDCGCCAGTGARTPLAVENRPGLTALAYRAGTHADFLESMRAALSSAGHPALAGLSARSGDFSLALLDGWATVADVLTFYQERIANEAFLRTATERRSVLELARAIGYELDPGAAAATPLAFTLEDVPGAPEAVVLERGTRVQSVPGPGERPQTFETVEAVEARPEWNRMRARQTRPQDVRMRARGIWVQGAPAPVAVGDGVLLVGEERLEDRGSERWDFRIVSRVATDALNGRTWIEWERGLGSVAPWVLPARDPRLYVFRQRAGLFGHNAPTWNLLPDDVRARYGGARTSAGGDAAPLVGRRNDEENGEPPPLPASPDEDWPGLALDPRSEDLHLDALYPRLVSGTWMVLSDPDYHELYQLRYVRGSARVGFGLSGKTTLVRVDTLEHLEKFSVRETVAFIQSEELPIAPAPVAEPVPPREVELDEEIAGLEAGRTLIATGPRARLRTLAGLPVRDDGGAERYRTAADEVLEVMGQPEALAGRPRRLRVRVRDAALREGVLTARVRDMAFVEPEDGAEELVQVVAIESVDAGPGRRTRLTLLPPLAHAYDRTRFRFLGNVARATHGEARAERLGSGDATRPYQRFPLRQPPLTHVPDPESPSGASTTLTVRVDGVAWKEVPTLFGRAPRDRVYTTRRLHDGATVVQFGDGREGARLPTGAENVEAEYRTGIGRTGNVRAGQLSLLMTRALGVRGVVNPLPASGGTEPQELDDARDAAPRTVLTLDRVVSLRDYEDFARGYAGVARAQAVWTWHGSRRGVLVTVAGPDGDAVPEAGSVAAGLAAALARFGDPHVPVRVVGYRPVRFRLEAAVRRRDEHRSADVLARAEAALRARFSFAGRRFGQRVWLSEVVAVIQSVPGVRAAHLDLLYREDGLPGHAPFLLADAPAAGCRAAAAAGAELLTLDLRPGDVEVLP